MGATRRLLATTPHLTQSVAAVLLAFKSIPSTVFLPTTALLRVAKGCKGWLNSVRGARVKALGFLVASALCASPAWSVDRVAISNWAAEALNLPYCGDPAVYGLILAEFRGRHWASGVAPVGIRGREVPRTYWPRADMPRRFCEGEIKSQSSADRPGCRYISPSYYPVCYPIYYAIIANGPGYQLEWCAVGLDRAWPVDPRCRLARP
jgi:hypothetical protein